MTRPSTLDVASFQKLLASAYVVQQSGLDTRSLSSIVEMQRLLAAGRVDADAIMHMAAQRARNVANATGVAIGLLRGDQLVYRAGSGSASTYVGRNMAATLSMARGASSEILRVENAQTDGRIEAAVCRQFGAESLLILPICRERALAGVLEVFYEEPHRFPHVEVRAYQLMAALVGEALAGNARPVLVKPPARPAAKAQPSRTSHQHAISRACGASTAVVAKPPVWKRKFRIRLRPPKVALQLRSVPWRKIPWRAGVATALVLGMACFLVLPVRQLASPAASVPQISNGAPQPVPLGPIKPVAEVAPITAPSSTVEVQVTRKPVASARRWVRVGDHELDYVNRDVTVRHFTTSPPPRPVQHLAADRNEVQIGQDVTVRHFPVKTDSTPARPQNQ